MIRSPRPWEAIVEAIEARRRAAPGG
ncbi:MAG: hypothetical protein RLZZ565_980, partial [Planctomycetota bacterium]